MFVLLGNRSGKVGMNLRGARTLSGGRGRYKGAGKSPRHMAGETGGLLQGWRDYEEVDNIV